MTIATPLGEPHADALQAAQIVEGVVGNAWATDADGRFIYVTPAALAFLDLNLAELNLTERDAFGWKRVVHPDDYEAAAAAWRRSLQTGERYSVEHRLLRAHGVYGWGRSSGQPVRDEQGRIAGWYGAVTDCGVPAFFSMLFADVNAGAAEGDTAPDGLPSMNLIHPDDRPAAAQAAARAFWGGVRQVISYRHLQPDGTYRWTELHADPGYGVSVDVDPLVLTPDEAWTTAKSLGETTEAVRAAKVIETLHGAAFAFDASGKFTYATPIAQTSIAMTLEDLNRPLGGGAFVDGGDLGWKLGVHPDDYDRAAARLRHCMRTGEDFNFEYRVLRATGQYVWHRFAIRPTRDNHGRVTGWYGIGFDIDVYKKTEAALRERERELSQLVDMVPSHVWRLRPNGEPTFFNKRMSDYLGIELVDTERPDSSRLDVLVATVHPEDASTFRETLGRCLSTGDSFSMRYRLRRADGMYHWMSSRAEPLRDPGGQIVQWYGLCHDIDDQVRAEEGLRQASERLARASQAASLAELSASIAHEVNQPLAAVVAYSHACERWLTSDPPNIERARETAEYIIQDANAAADVVSRIRALFKQSVTSRSQASLDSVVLEVRGLMAGEATRRGIDLDVEAEGGLPSIPLDRVQIQQVLINLIRNGLEAMESAAGSRVLTVRVRRSEDGVRTEISDCGPGIDSPEKVFEPFFTTKEQGMGMGLAIGRSIIESHGGRLWAENNQAGGATFIFSLPADQSGQ